MPVARISWVLSIWGGVESYITHLTPRFRDTTKPSAKHIAESSKSHKGRCVNSCNNILVVSLLVLVLKTRAASFSRTSLEYHLFGKEKVNYS